MEINEELCEQITRMAAAAFSPAEIGFALGIDQPTFDIWMRDENHQAIAL